MGRRWKSTAGSPTRLEQLRQQLRDEQQVAGQVQLSGQFQAAPAGGLKGKRTLAKPPWLKIKSTEVRQVYSRVADLHIFIYSGG